MNYILYYSNFCEPSKKLLQKISKIQNLNNIHFICIDKRIKDNNGETFIILQTGQQIILPKNITRVPALLSLNDNYNVIYGDKIYEYINPTIIKEIKQATQNNMEPINFQDGFNSFSGCGIVSDNYSFLDQSDKELSVEGNGGLRQMHNYVTLNDSFNLNMTLQEENNEKIKELDIEALKNKRRIQEEELSNINNKINI